MIIIPAAVIAFFTFALMQLIHRRFGDVVPCSLFLCGFIMFIGQYLFSTFTVGIAVIVAVACIGLGITIYKKSIRSCLSPGLLTYLLICLIVAIYDYNRHYTDFDELWHWGMMIKESLRLDQFYCVPESRMVIHKDYPPFLCMIELVFVKLSGKYSEAIATMGIHVFSLCVVFCPLSEKITSSDGINKNSIGSALIKISGLLIFGIGLINIFDHAHVARTILGDIPLALTLAYILLLIVTEDVYRTTFGSVCFILASGAMLLIKQSGTPLSILTLFTYLLVGILCKTGTKKRLFVTAGISSVFMAICYFSWYSYVRKCNIADIRASSAGGGQFDFSKLDYSEFINIVLKRDSGERADTFWNFLHSLFQRNISSFPWVTISFVTSLLLLLVFLMLLDVLGKGSFSHKKIIALSISAIVGFIGYAFMLAVLFVFCFTSDEMAELRGYERYMDGIVLGFVLAFMLWGLVTWMQRNNDSAKKKRYSLIIIVCLLALNGKNLSYLLPQSVQPDPYKSYRETGEMIALKVKDNSTIAMSYDAAAYGWDGFVHSLIYQYINNCDLPLEMNIYNADYQDAKIQKNTENVLSKADYLYVINTNDSMDDYFSILNNGEPLEAFTLYKVNDGKLIEEYRVP